MKERSLPQPNKLYVIGIGYRPLEKRAKDILGKAGVILASSRLYEVFQRYDEYEAVKDRVKVINRVPETIDFIKAFAQSPNRDPRPGRCPLVLLASGDPMFFGIGRRVREEFGDESVEILPDLSSMQEAFARINEPWDDAFFLSLHGGPDTAKRRKLPYQVADIPGLLEQHGKLGILTDRENSPVLIAIIIHSAIGSPHSAIEISVCERLGYPDEKVTRGTPEEIAGRSFADPNVVIVMKRMQEAGCRIQDEKHHASCILHHGSVFGLREEKIEHERGLITKDEVRAVTLHKLCLPPNGVFWDVGAGSGSVSLEAARLCPRLGIYALEKEQDRVETMRRNMAAFSVPVNVVQGTAPEALQDLPAPDRVFIGGSGGNMDEIVRAVQDRMSSGIVVINCTTLDTLNEALRALEKGGFSIEVAEISISRSKNVGGKRHMAALNPVFMVKGEKG